VVTDLRTNARCPPARYRQDRLQCTPPLSLACSVIRGGLLGRGGGSEFARCVCVCVCVVVSSLGGCPYYCRDSHACHVDVTDVTLVTDDDDDDDDDACRQFGVVIDSVDHSPDGFLHPPFISRLEPGGVAERLVTAPGVALSCDLLTYSLL